MSDFYDDEPAERGRDNLLPWTIFIMLLVGFAAFCWIGSFYVFGHPEKGFSYGLLRKLGKLDPPKRFSLVGAPRGEFLDADKLFDRFGRANTARLKEQNTLLLRDYLRNYEQTKALVPYVVGAFNVMAPFKLGPSNLFPSGVAVLAQSKENPDVLLEMIFPTGEENLPQLQRMLPTGLDIKLVRTLDLTAVLGARQLPDGKLLVTAVPLLYGHYTSTEATGTFDLEPPESPNVGAGLPVLNLAAIEKAGAHYAAFVARPDAPKTDPELMRVEVPTAVKSEEKPVLRAEAVRKAEPVATPPPPPPAATPPPPPAAASGDTEMLDGMPVARAIPVNRPAATPPALTDPATGQPINAEPVPAATPAAPLQPFGTPATVVAPPPSNWTVYQPGRMPRGRLVDVNAARDLAGRGPASEPVYLRGDFQVAASADNRAVLTGTRGGRNVRVVVEYPGGMSAPAPGENLSRDGSRPFQITEVRRGENGQVTVYVREVTGP